MPPNDPVPRCGRAAMDWKTGEARICLTTLEWHILLGPAPEYAISTRLPLADYLRVRELVARLPPSTLTAAEESRIEREGACERARLAARKAAL